MLNTTIDGLDGGGKRILVVDDDREIQATCRSALEGAGYEVWSAASADEAEKRLQDGGIPHLAVIDIGMPGVSGVELSRWIKGFCDLPIVLLTGNTDENTIVTTLEEFAEDYIMKPVSLSVLVARVNRVLRRIRDFSYALEPVVRVDDRLSLELSRCSAIIDGEHVNLTPTEAKLLHVLIRDAGRTVRTEFLLHRVWPFQEVFEDTLRVHVYRLRQKIERDPKMPRYVVTMRGAGYSFPHRLQRSGEQRIGSVRTKTAPGGSGEFSA